MKQNILNVATIWVAAIVLFLGSAAFSQYRDEPSSAKAFVDSNASSLENLPLFDKIVSLRKLAPAALAAGDTETAEKFARQLQDKANEFKEKNKRDRSTLDHATHVSNTVLGLVALEKGNLSGAKEHLLASGRLASGSPTLKSFGPNMLLAKKMIEKGEREVVIEYFDLCSAFWKMENGRLEKWKSIVNQGGMPDFQANLAYEISYWKHS